MNDLEKIKMCEDLINHHEIKKKTKTQKYNELIAFHLRKIRIARKKTQAELARTLGVSPVTICQYEKGKLKLSAAKLFEIAAYYEVSMSYFIGEVKK